VLALNVYPAVGQQVWKKKFYIWTQRHERERLFATILRRAGEAGKPVWITELQAEPWEPGQIVHTGEQNPPTAWPQATVATFQEVHALGFPVILLWGAEYWYFRKLRYRDTAWWTTMTTLINGAAPEPASR